MQATLGQKVISSFLITKSLKSELYDYLFFATVKKKKKGSMRFKLSLS